MRQLLTFHLGAERYGLDIARILEIVEAPRRFYIPNAPRCYQGAINFHGSILPVLDLGRLLDFEISDSDERVIVLDLDLGTLALAVSKLGGIVPISGGELLAGKPEDRERTCITQLFRFQDDMINLLDTGLLLGRLGADQ